MRLDDAVHVWRTWALYDDPGSRTPTLRPITGDRRIWTPRRPARARCTIHRRHRAPDPGCRCGLYAVKDPNLLRYARDPAVLGTVALWGRIMEHELGFRGEFAYPQRLSLICSLCFWQWGAGTREVDHVARVERHQLVPLCDTHLTLAIATGYDVTERRDAAVVRTSLLATYAVDPLDRGLAARLTSPLDTKEVGISMQSR
jgi:hypothetical protein